jgi:hypothetical protein
MVDYLILPLNEELLLLYAVIVINYTYVEKYRIYRKCPPMLILLQNKVVAIIMR